MALAIAEKDGLGAAGIGAHGEIENAIAVQVDQRHAIAGIASAADVARGLEGACAVAEVEVNRRFPVAPGGEDKVRMAIAVHVANRERGGVIAGIGERHEAVETAQGGRRLRGQREEGGGEQAGGKAHGRH